MKEDALSHGKSAVYNNKWRERLPNEIDKKIQPVLRLKTPLIGKTIINDKVQGLIEYDNKDIDDLGRRFSKSRCCFYYYPCIIYFFKKI